MRVVNDRRRLPRVAWSGEAVIQTRRGEFRAVGLDLSADGMALLVAASMKAKEKVRVHTLLGDFPLLAQARVVRVTKTKNGYRWALRFEQLDQGMRANLESFVRQQLSSAARIRQAQLYAERLRNNPALRPPPTPAPAEPAIEPVRSSDDAPTAPQRVVPSEAQELPATQTPEPPAEAAPVRTPAPLEIELPEMDAPDTSIPPLESVASAPEDVYQPYHASVPDEEAALLGDVAAPSKPAPVEAEPTPKLAPKPVAHTVVPTSPGLGSVSGRTLTPGVIEIDDNDDLSLEDILAEVGGDSEPEPKAPPKAQSKPKAPPNPPPKPKAQPKPPPEPEPDLEPSASGFGDVMQLDEGHEDDDDGDTIRRPTNTPIIGDAGLIGSASAEPLVAEPAEDESAAALIGAPAFAQPEPGGLELNPLPPSARPTMPPGNPSEAAPLGDGAPFDPLAGGPGETPDEISFADVMPEESPADDGPAEPPPMMDELLAPEAAPAFEPVEPAEPASAAFEPAEPAEPFVPELPLPAPVSAEVSPPEPSRTEVPAAPPDPPAAEDVAAPASVVPTPVAAALDKPPSSTPPPAPARNLYRDDAAPFDPYAPNPEPPAGAAPLRLGSAPRALGELPPTVEGLYTPASNPDIEEASGAYERASFEPFPSPEQGLYGKREGVTLNDQRGNPRQRLASLQQDDRSEHKLADQHDLYLGDIEGVTSGVTPTGVKRAMTDEVFDDEESSGVDGPTSFHGVPELVEAEPTKPVDMGIPEYTPAPHDVGRDSEEVELLDESDIDFEEPSSASASQVDNGRIAPTHPEFNVIPDFDKARQPSAPAGPPPAQSGRTIVATAESLGLNLPPRANPAPAGPPTAPSDFAVLPSFGGAGTSGQGFAVVASYDEGEGAGAIGGGTMIATTEDIESWQMAGVSRDMGSIDEPIMPPSFDEAQTGLHTPAPGSLEPPLDPAPRSEPAPSMVDDALTSMRLGVAEAPAGGAGFELNPRGPAPQVAAPGPSPRRATALERGGRPAPPPKPAVVQPKAPQPDPAAAPPLRGSGSVAPAARTGRRSMVEDALAALKRKTEEKRKSRGPEDEDAAPAEPAVSPAVAKRRRRLGKAEISDPRIADLYKAAITDLSQSHE